MTCEIGSQVYYDTSRLEKHFEFMLKDITESEYISSWHGQTLDLHEDSEKHLQQFFASEIFSVLSCLSLIFTLLPLKELNSLQ